MHKLRFLTVAVTLGCALLPLQASAQTQDEAPVHIPGFSGAIDGVPQRVRQSLPGYVSITGTPSGAATQTPTPTQLQSQVQSQAQTQNPPQKAAISTASVGLSQSPASHRGYVASNFITTTTSLIEGYNIVDYRGLVEGACVRVPTWSEDAAAGSSEVVGGSIDSYAQLCEEARIQAFTTLVERAKKLGANAVVGIHFDSQVMPLDKGKFASGVVCVGTAVVAKRK